MAVSGLYQECIRKSMIYLITQWCGSFSVLSHILAICIKCISIWWHNRICEIIHSQIRNLRIEDISNLMHHILYKACEILWNHTFSDIDRWKTHRNLRMDDISKFRLLLLVWGFSYLLYYYILYIIYIIYYIIYYILYIIYYIYYIIYYILFYFILFYYILFYFI